MDIPGGGKEKMHYETYFPHNSSFMGVYSYLVTDLAHIMVVVVRNFGHGK